MAQGREEDEAGSRLREHQEEEVRERTAISAHVVYEAVLAEGQSELERPTSALVFSGLAAGLSMGFSFLTQGYLQSELPNRPWAHLVSKLGYSMGFLIVILGRQQLFTENTLTPILPLLKKKQFSILKQILRLWTAVFISNWLGTLLFGWVLAHSGVIAESARPTFAQIASAVIARNFVNTFINAIFAGWLIALLVWLLPFAESARVTVIILMTYVIALGSFAHVVAGSVDVCYLVMMGGTTWHAYFLRFLLPAFLGNIAGGILLVAALNHAQVSAGTERSKN